MSKKLEKNQTEQHDKLEQINACAMPKISEQALFQSTGINHMISEC
jgi:hypothetical protein